MLRSCLTWAPVSAMGSRFLCMGLPRDGALIYVSCPTIAQERRGVERVCPVKKNADAGVSGQCGLRTGYELGAETGSPCNKRPTDLADVVEHVASLRYALGARLAGTGILNHVLSDVVAQTVDLILVAMLKHAGKNLLRPLQGYRRYRDEAIQSM